MRSEEQLKEMIHECWDSLEVKKCISRGNFGVVFRCTGGGKAYARDLAEIIYKMVDERTAYKNVGTYHFSNEGVCSWYDFTKMIAEYAGNTACDIQPCHSDEFPSKVKRPAFSVLDKSKVKNTFGVFVPYWTVSLKTCLLYLQK